jgi:hypothetical protein
MRCMGATFFHASSFGTPSKVIDNGFSGKVN